MNSLIKYVQRKNDCNLHIAVFPPLTVAAGVCVCWCCGHAPVYVPLRIHVCVPAFASLPPLCLSSALSLPLSLFSLSLSLFFPCTCMCIGMRECVRVRSMRVLCTCVRSRVYSCTMCICLIFLALVGCFVECVVLLWFHVGST